MHSSHLRGTDFSLTYRGESVSHARFFADFQITERVGLLAPDRFDGLGAVVLVMAYVTAFYDRYRETGEEFFGYPDFFTFQQSEPVANYSMFDIWPHHKNVRVSEDRNQRAASIADREVSILLLPEGHITEVAIEPVGIESLRRNIRRCFVYAASGCLTDPDLVVACAESNLTDWAREVLGSAPESAADTVRNKWEKILESDRFPEQMFREVSLDEAIVSI